MELVEKLWAIEEIKQLKARYFRCVDTKDDEGFFDVFTDDIDWLWYADDNATVLRHVTSKQEFRDWFVEIAPGRSAGFSVHHGHMPEIEILSDTMATGIWAIADYIVHPGEEHLNFRGYGHYHEEYRKGADGRWLISKVVLTRLLVEQLKD